MSAGCRRLAPVLALLGSRLGSAVSGEDLFACIAAIAGSAAYTERFQRDLVRPELRIPLTADAALVRDAVDLGRTIVWLHSYGERFADPQAGRPAEPPRLPAADAPRYERAGTLPSSPDDMPDTLEYDAVARRLHIGKGYIDNVPPEVWAFEVSGKQILKQWFSYRRRNRERPLMGDRRGTRSRLAR